MMSAQTLKKRKQMHSRCILDAFYVRVAEAKIVEIHLNFQVRRRHTLGMVRQMHSVLGA